MYFLPAIDILDGRVVRLAEGDYNRVTVYDENPVLRAQLLEEAGAKWLHIVDLDGAKTGELANADIVSQILKSTSLHVEVGGGIRSLESARRLLDTGADRVIFGTALVKDRDLAVAAIEEFGSDSVVAGIDAKDGDVKVEGWVQGAELNALSLASEMAKIGYEHLVYTDIKRDGMLNGIAPAAYVEMYQAFGNPVIASGGISSLKDISELAKISDALEGVISGRAIYDDSFTVAEAVAVCRGVDRKDDGFLESLETPIDLQDLQ